MLALLEARGRLCFKAARAAVRATLRLAPLAGQTWTDEEHDPVWIRHYLQALDWLAGADVKAAYAQAALHRRRLASRSVGR
jgi:hypothetical protein